MSHMLADTLPELCEMADRIGVSRSHYQDWSKASCPHFDVSEGKRQLAFAAGATPVTTSELVAVMRRIKDAAIALKKQGLPTGWEP